jgi:hypothetical protein
VGDVWGIGRQYAAKLTAACIDSAADLARVSDAWARKHLGGVVGARLAQELQDQPCSGLHRNPQPTECKLLTHVRPAIDKICRCAGGSSYLPFASCRKASGTGRYRLCANGVHQQEPFRASCAPALLPVGHVHLTGRPDS